MFESVWEFVCLVAVEVVVVAADSPVAIDVAVAAVDLEWAYFVLELDFVLVYSDVEFAVEVAVVAQILWYFGVHPVHLGYSNPVSLIHCPAGNRNFHCRLLRPKGAFAVDIADVGE